MKKVPLQQLEIQSFVTSPDHADSATLRLVGGGGSVLLCPITGGDTIASVQVCASVNCTTFTIATCP
ncbi:MAG: hypothetical protein QNK37_00730 [Acidobacteriota bacterium]|nr:hypothetical protein [Acidobacteriota bacterium]